MIPILKLDSLSPKLVFITPIFDNYGAARTLNAILREAEEMNLKAEVWYPRDSEIDPKISSSFSPFIEFIQMDLPVLRRRLVYNRNFPIKFLNYLYCIFAIRGLVKSTKYSKTIFHIFTSASILAIFFTPRRRRFLSVHEFSKNRVERVILRLLFTVSGKDRVFASKSVKDHYSLSGKIIYSGANVKQFAHLRKTPYLPGKKLKILCVGRFTESKGQLTAIKALAELSKEFSNFSALFLGGTFYGKDSYLKDCVEYLKRHDLEKFISFRGEISDVTDYYRKSHVVIVPSIHPEAFGKVVVEGMASENIVIATNIGGPTEIIYDQSNGLLFEPNDYVALSKILLAIARFEIQNSGISKKAKRDAKNFDEVNSGAEYMNYVNQLIETRIT